MNIKEYERLTALYIDCIYRVAVNGCRNAADAEDVVQNTFMKLWVNKNPFNDDEHAKRWLIRVAMNERRSIWRSPWRKNTTSLEELTHEPIFPTPEKSDLYYAVMDADKIPTGRAFILL